MTRLRSGRFRPGSPRSPRSRASVAAAVSAAALVAGCTIPITAQTLTGGALNAGALLFIDRINDGSDAAEGSYAYVSELEADTLAALFEAAVEQANRSHMFSRIQPATPTAEADGAGSADAAGRVESADGAERAADGVVLAQAAGRAWRPDDPPRPETFSDRQWTPAPLFSIRAGSPEVRGDTLMWIVTHRASRQAAFLLTPRTEGAATRVAIVPYDPPADVFLSVPEDHAQRNAVEALHQAFYFAARARFGPGVFAGSAGDLGP